MNDLFLREARGETTERRPVWMMRQAGRYMPEYRAIRAEHDFLTMCRTPELVAEVTLQPVRHIGVDAAILFADILLVLDAMGSELVFAQGEGPTFPTPVRNRSDLGRLEHPDVDATLGYVFDAVRATRREIETLEEPVPLIGFAGTPWTLAAYLTEGRGSQTFPHLMSWSWRDPEGLEELLGLITDVTVDYVLGQVEAGAQALQLFDTWGGLLDQARWRALAMPTVIRIVEAVRKAHPDVPLIYYGKDTAHLLPALAELPVDVLSVDWRQPLSVVREAVGDKVLQGNLDPMALLSTPDVIERQAARLLEDGSGGGHVVNLGHGIHKTTPPENARAFVEAVQRLSRGRPASS